jgi:hypothetical protein
MALALTQNTLFTDSSKAVDLARLKAPMTHRRQVTEAKRELRDVRRTASAAEAIAGLDRETEIYGFTKGQFSLLNLIQAVFAVTGPAHFSLSTWTAAAHEIESLAAMKARGDITGIRLLIDFSMARREPAMTAQMREKLGRDNIRVAATHSKFAIFQNAQWKVTLRSSMNLNMNPRNEDFTIAHDPPLASFLNVILDEVWAKQKAEVADLRPGEIIRHWNEDL